MWTIIYSKTKEYQLSEVYLYKIKNFLSCLERILTREIKEEDFKAIWRKIKNEATGFTFEEKKVFAMSFMVLLTLLWINGNGFVLIAHSEEGSITNAQSKENDSNYSLKEENNSGSHNVGKLNGYELKSPGEQCKDDKSNKQASELCGKDDEDEIKRQKAEETRKASIAVTTKPRAVKVSCREGSNGHPSKSDNKGKHTDEDCCPDPDEWPKSGCVYDAKGYSIMLSGPAKKK
ncbi:MAG: hypothetical protein V1804_02735 [Patescibacteria group bacterium]